MEIRVENNNRRTVTQQENVVIIQRITFFTYNYRIISRKFLPKDVQKRENRIFRPVRMDFVQRRPENRE